MVPTSARFKAFVKTLPKQPASVNTMIEDEQGRLLLVKAHYKSYWSTPGGWIDKDESPRTAAMRELHEEVGLVVGEDQLELARVIYRVSDAVRTNQFIFTLSGFIASDTVFALQASEIADYAWTSRDDIVSGDPNMYSRAVVAWAKNEPAYLEHSL